jgi:glycosyltransferase involved in cell wall biosynthesis
MNQMKILVVTESYWPNADGGALFERRLVQGLIGRGNEVSVWTPGPRFRSYDERDGAYTIHREKGVTFLANKKYKVSLFPFIKALQVIRRERPNVIHIHNCYWMGLFTMFWAHIYHIPVVATNHFMPENALLNLSGIDMLYRPLHRLIWSYLVWFHNRASYVTSPTPTAIKLLVDHGLKVPSEAISNGIDTAVFKPGQDAAGVIKKYGLATDRPILLYVGRLDGEKRLDLIISALPLIKQQQNVQLVMSGFGVAMDDLKAQAQRLGVTGDIVFTGYVEEDEKPLIYNAATMFVISSPAELQSIVTLEAMATGLPIISVDVAALSELCHDGENGYLFPRDDYQALADRVNTLLKNKALQKDFSAESIKIVQASHTTGVTFANYENAYKRAVKGAEK